MAASAEFIREFRAYLNEMERWADAYVANPTVTEAEAERELGRSLQRYILHARVHAAEVRPDEVEMNRRRAKIRGLYSALHERWFTRPRRRRP